MKKIGVVFLVIALVFIGVLFGLKSMFFYKYVKIDENTDLGINTELLDYNVDIKNTLIMGVDSRENKYTSTRSDLIQIASLNMEKGTLKMTSIMRDTYLYIPDKEFYDKINHAYAYGCDVGLIRALNNNLDLNLHEFVSVNFEAIMKMVDLIEGINVNIEADEISKVPGINSQGKHLLNGKQALSYSRIRYTKGGDVRRTSRQRVVVQAISDKLKGRPYKEYLGVIQVMLPYINTSLTLKDLSRLLSTYLTINNLVIQGNTFPKYQFGRKIKKIWYMVPNDLEKNVIKLHNDIYETKNYHVTDTVRKHSTTIRNKAKRV
jgi:LCP family protein required for cell wall assembly